MGLSWCVFAFCYQGGGTKKIYCTHKLKVYFPSFLSISKMKFSLSLVE